MAHPLQETYPSPLMPGPRYWSSEEKGKEGRSRRSPDNTDCQTAATGDVCSGDTISDPVSVSRSSK
jgi:hypothetical protein